MTKSTSKLFQSEEPKPMNDDAMNLPAVADEEVGTVDEQEEEQVNVSDDGIQDIDLSVIQKKRFRINGDPNKILELNTSDLNIVSRLSSAYDRLLEDMEKVGGVLANLPNSEDDLTKEVEDEIAHKLEELNEIMKKELNYIFNAPVGDICSDGGSMYDPFEGAFRFEHIIEAILKLYERNLDSEFNKMRRRVSAKTSKYIQKYHK